MSKEEKENSKEEIGNSNDFESATLLTSLGTLKKLAIEMVVAGVDLVAQGFFEQSEDIVHEEALNIANERCLGQALYVSDGDFSCFTLLDDDDL